MPVLSLSLPAAAQSAAGGAGSSPDPLHLLRSLSLHRSSVVSFLRFPYYFIDDREKRGEGSLDAAAASDTASDAATAAAARIASELGIKQLASSPPAFQGQERCKRDPRLLLSLSFSRGDPVCRMQERCAHRVYQ